VSAKKPGSRPGATRDEVFKMIMHLMPAGVAAAPDLLKPPILVGVRGYYLDSMGKSGVNDRSIYDDAIILVESDGMTAFNANTDPSAWRDGIATLKPGVWRYQRGKHGINRQIQGGPPAYPALVQAAEVTVTRDGRGEDSGWFGINIHRGGAVGTSSLGCQTIVPEQWDEFIGAVGAAMDKADVKRIAYVLVDNTPEWNRRAAESAPAIGATPQEEEMDKEKAMAAARAAAEAALEAATDKELVAAVPPVRIEAGGKTSEFKLSGIVLGLMSGLAALFGFNMEPAMQLELFKAVSACATGIAAVFATVRTWRKNAWDNAPE
jgi:lysozyme